MKRKADDIAALYAELMEMSDDQAFARFRQDRADWGRAKREAREALISLESAARSGKNLPLQ